MKLSSRKTGTLVPNDDDSDSDLQEFSLPKKRIIKPGKSTYVARLEIPVSKNIVFCRVSIKLVVYFVLFIALKIVNLLSNLSEDDVIAVAFVLQSSFQCFLSLQFCV